MKLWCSKDRLLSKLDMLDRKHKDSVKKKFIVTFSEEKRDFQEPNEKSRIAELRIRHS